MRIPTRLAALLAGLALSTASGCLFPSLPAPAIPLDAREQRDVVACQKAMTQQAKKIQDVAWQRFARCSEEALALRLEEERELNSSNIGDYVARRQKLVARCEAGFARIGGVTTRAIDAVVARCKPVETLILEAPERGDPLGLKALNSFVGAIGGLPAFENVEEMAGGLCSQTLSAAENLFALTVPRTGDMLRAYFAIQSEGDFEDYLATFVDPRC